MSSDERRREERIPAIIKVTYRNAGDMKAEYSQNISKGGLFVVTDEDFEHGHRLELHLALAGTGRSVPVPAEVRWVGERDGHRGVGLRFMLEDPVIAARIAAMVNAVYDPIPPSITGERCNLLLCDPNPHASRLFKEGLEAMAVKHFGLQDFLHVVVAKDGREALGYLRTSRFAMAIIELRSTEVDGLDLIRRVRTEISQALPICAMSRPFPGDRTEALSSGADLFVHKPVQLRGLFNTVSMMLRLKQPGGGDSEVAA